MREVAGRGRVPPVMPVPVARAIAGVGEGVSRVIRRPPLLPRGQLTYFLWQAHPDSSKAQRELGWKPTPLEEGIRKTLHAMGLLDAPIGRKLGCGRRLAQMRPDSGTSVSAGDGVCRACGAANPERLALLRQLRRQPRARSHLPELRRRESRPARPSATPAAPAWRAEPEIAASRAGTATPRSTASASR